MDPLIALSSRRYAAGVSPQLGGTLAYFGLAGDPAVDFVRSTKVRALVEEDVRSTAGYPLVPYSNRIGEGRFSFEGRQYALLPNSPITPHPIHGVGWLRPWSVAASTPASVSLVLTYVASGTDDTEWPWSFDARQIFTLDDDGLSWSLSITNTDRREMPAGIGMHPFFPKSPRMEMQFAAKSVLRNDQRMLPIERTGVPADWDFAQLRPVADLSIDNCFGGWSKEVVLAWPERNWGLRIKASDAFGHLVVFTSPARDCIAIEPVSHANNAVNLVEHAADTGLAILAPGDTLAGWFLMRPIPPDHFDDA